MFSKRLLILFLLLFNTSAFAADSTVSALTAASALDGTELYYCVQGGADRKCTGTQVKTLTSASPTFTGTVTIPTPFTLGGISVTSTGTQLNYLTAATGTTGTTSTNVVFSTSPTLITPALGTPSALVLTNATGLPTTALTGTLQAAQEPAHTGDVTNSAGSLALTIANNAVTFAKMATQATNTIIGNATSGTAIPTALAIGSCSTAGSALIWTTNTGFSCNTSITAAAVPASGLTGATLAAGVTASSLTSVGTLTGGATGAGFTVALSTSTITGTLSDARLAFNSATLAANPSQPTGTTSTTGVMMGVGTTCTITPVNSTRIIVSFSGVLTNNTINDGTFARFNTGTGTAPTNGAAITGTARTTAATATSFVGGANTPWSQTWVVTGLTPGTAYWLDIVLGAVTGGTASIQNVNCSAIEL